MAICRNSTIGRSVAVACLVLGIPSCTHLKYASVQAEYARIQSAEPAQRKVKHMIERETFFVHGRCIDAAGRYDEVPKAIAAFSSRYRRNERVDTMHSQVAGSHYGLNLPEGAYDLLVFADIDGDHVFESREAVGRRAIQLSDGTLTPVLWTISHQVRRKSHHPIAPSAIYTAAKLRLPATPPPIWTCEGAPHAL
jgi:hypothetical protein